MPRRSFSWTRACFLTLFVRRSERRVNGSGSDGTVDRCAAITTDGLPGNRLSDADRVDRPCRRGGRRLYYRGQQRERCIRGMGFPRNARNTALISAHDGSSRQVEGALRGSRDAAILLDKDVDALSRAFDRIMNAELPAKKGGKGAKDAVILEHALGLTRVLRAAGFAHTCIFASSNTADFAASRTTTLHPTLVPAFGTPTDLHYAASLTAAVTLLRGEGWVP